MGRFFATPTLTLSSTFADMDHVLVDTIQNHAEELHLSHEADHFMSGNRSLLRLMQRRSGRELIVDFPSSNCAHRELLRGSRRLL